MKNTKRYNSY